MATEHGTLFCIQDNISVDVLCQDVQDSHITVYLWNQKWFAITPRVRQNTVPNCRTVLSYLSIGNWQIVVMLHFSHISQFSKCGSLYHSKFTDMCHIKVNLFCKMWSKSLICCDIHQLHLPKYNIHVCISHPSVTISLANEWQSKHCTLSLDVTVHCHKIVCIFVQ